MNEIDSLTLSVELYKFISDIYPIFDNAESIIINKFEIPMNRYVVEFYFNGTPYTFGWPKNSNCLFNNLSISEFIIYKSDKAKLLEIINENIQKYENLRTKYFDED